MPRKYELRFPSKRLFEIYSMIEDMCPTTKQEEKELAILQAVFIEGVNANELHRQKRFYSNQGKPMSIRRIQQIITQYVPDYYECRKKQQKSQEYKKIRAEQAEVKKKLYLQNGGKCAVCGEDDAELHHMIPLKFGGDNDPANLILLCRSCHDRASIYAEKLLKQISSKKQEPIKKDIDTP